MDKYPNYLGDGVYVSFDGYQLWLAANDHRNKVIALEPDVMKRLWEHWQFVLASETNRG